MSEYITIKRAELEQVLEALKNPSPLYIHEIGRALEASENPSTLHIRDLYKVGTAMGILRAALAQQPEPMQEPAFYGFMSADGTRVDLCFTPNAPRSDGTYATAYYTALPQRKPLTVEDMNANPDDENTSFG